MKHISEIECCPHCGHDEYYTKEQAYGSVQYRRRFDGAEAENGEMYGALSYKGGKRAYCSDCDKLIANM